MSKIAWTDVTWNPVTGCSPIAVGCSRCYAQRMHDRLRAMGQEKYQHDFREVHYHSKELDRPRHWRKPRMVFVNSMSDTFHESVPFRFVDDVWFTMSDIGWHTYQILTKRPGRLCEYLTRHWRNYEPLPNVWLGASASTQEDLERVVPPLLETPAAVRFLSLEPLLGPIDLSEWIGYNPTIHFVIVGSESGPNRRECRTEWVESIVAQCEAAGVPCFVKQIHINGKVVKSPAGFPQEMPR